MTGICEEIKEIQELHANDLQANASGPYPREERLQE